jgi:hypothetical protein
MLTRALLAAGMAAAALQAKPSWASSAAPAKHGAAPAADEGAPKRTDILDLGLFRIRSSRPTDREVSDLKFALHLVLAPKISQAEFHRLELWLRRLRDQVITAVRGADAADFDDPELKRLHRLILFRVKRLPIGKSIVDVYLTDFALDHGELLAEALAPPIKPSAPPKKPPGGGH